MSAYDSCPGVNFGNADPEIAGHFNDTDFIDDLETMIDHLGEDDEDTHLGKNTIEATQNLYNRVIGDYNGTIPGGLVYAGKLNTKWTIIYQFNSIFYTILSVQSVFLLLGVFVIPIRIITSCCHCFVSGGIHFAMIITTGVLRYNSAGLLCTTSLVQTSHRSSF